MKKKIITALTIIVIIIVTLYWLTSHEYKAKEATRADNTIYVQSNLPGECRAIITQILNDAKSSPSEIPCEVQLRRRK
ncbi:MULTISPECIES: hypothetical protein [unclassified Serratia (in: enterobacteria)]|uniref:hypothetical protein n=1 Tax=unclassified Serratia (in: enterobacteria) TaxID=2647522 RepID=UPI0005019DC4|nr:MULTISPECIES: hypothetical protein [unclassified Serratia (in: enterobacteria)]KFK92938.1 hypothetical protein JV45_18590 [Serratia sp. Ag2]KFL00037.1 hypothetical protein IV04_03760 [Serratia sp. Ag1]